jgi:lipopolysaccharide export system protein LptA
MRLFFHFILGFIGLCFILLGISFGEEEGRTFLGAEGFSQFPIDIRSDQMEATAEQDRLLFSGNVHVAQGGLKLNADRVEVYVNLKNRMIQRLIAKGSVKLEQGDRVAYGEEAVFDGVLKEITLTGRPQLWQGRSFIQGDKIIVSLTQDRIRVQGAKASIDPVLFEKGGERGPQS